MVRRPPRSTRTDTLFPYTTLFRSGIQHVFQAAQDIIGIQHRIAAHLAQAIGTVAQNISKRTGKHAHLTMKGNHAAETGSLMLICCRSEERRVGKECVSTCSSRCSPSP